MKKLPYKISVLIIMLITMSLAGCVKVHPSLSVSREEAKKLGSVVVKEGTIIDMTFVAGHDFVGLKFADGEIILSGFFWKTEKKDIRIGQTGTLSVSNNHDKKHCHCRACWWSWEVDAPEKEVAKLRTQEIKKADEVEDEWQRVNQIKNLEANELVLIKMKDDKVAIGFITYDKQWKLGMNKDKYHHGATLTNVSKWKRINLE